MALGVELCTDASQWDAFVASSPQGNLFCTSPFLRALPVRCEHPVLKDGGRILAGAVVLHDERGAVVPLPYPFCLYQGMLLAREWADMPAHRQASATLEWVEAFCADLVQRYDRISLCLHPSFSDLRAFQWMHYHEAEKGRFAVDLRYTGWIDLDTWPGFDAYLESIRPTRRNEYRKSGRSGLTVEVSQDLDALDQLHRLTFERQGLQRDEHEGRLVRAVAAQAVERGFGEMRVCRTAGGAIASATFFLHDGPTAYYWIGANHPDHRQTNAGAYLFLNNVEACYARGMMRVDVLGINSPQRGGFKTSMNARPVPYFHVNWQRPHSPVPDAPSGPA